MKGTALRKHSLHDKTAASVLLKPFIKATVFYRVKTKQHTSFKNNRATHFLSRDNKETNLLYNHFP